jgi:hypothetical protein
MKKEKEIKKKDKVSLGALLSNKAADRYDADLELHTNSGQAFLLKWGILGMIYLLGMVFFLFEYDDQYPFMLP